MFRFILLSVILLSLKTAHASSLFGSVEAVTGDATLSRPTGAAEPVTAGMNVMAGDSIQTAANGEVQIVTLDRGFIAIRPDSRLRIDNYHASDAPDDSEILTLFNGAIRSITGWLGKSNPAGYLLHTPTATIGIRGTDHETMVLEHATDQDQPGVYDTVYEGATYMQTEEGELSLHQGQHAFAPAGSRALPRLLMQTPGFLKNRRLLLEAHIQQRKDALHREIAAHLQERDARKRQEEHRPPEIRRRKLEDRRDNMMRRRQLEH